MPGVSGAGQNQHIERHENFNRALQNKALQKQAGAGFIGGGNTFSHYQPAVQPSAGDSRIMPLAQPQPGAMDVLGTMNINDILAQLNGLKAESDETVAKAQTQSTLANREKQKTQRQQRIDQLQQQLDRGDNEKNDKCAIAKIIIGALLFGPIGIPLIISGGLDKKVVNDKAAAHNTMLQHHFGPALQDINGFEKEYAMDSIKDSLLGLPLDQQKHQAKLNELKNMGAIDPKLYADLSQLVAEKASPDAIHDRIFQDAVEGYVDGSMPSIEYLERGRQSQSSTGIDDSIKSVERDLAEARALGRNGDSDDFNLFLAQLARMMDEQDEAMRKVQDDLESANTAILSGARNQHSLLSQVQPRA